MRRLVPIPPERRISLDFEGTAVPAQEGEPVAVSLIAAGHDVLARSVKYHRPRGPFCLAAACSQCLMRVDGTPNLYACRVPARAGMRLQRQNSYPSAKVDVFSAIDWLFPRGLDHHAMFAGVPVAEQVMARVARHLAGLGLLPEAAAPERPPAESLETGVAVVGGGAAGLAAGEVLGAAGVPFVLLEREEALGGRWRTGAPEPEAPPLALPRGSGMVRVATTALGLYTDARGRFLAALSARPEGPRLLLVRASRFLLAPGGHAPLMPFTNNDLPGVLSGRAVSDLVRRRGVLPAEKPVLVGHGPELPGLAWLLRESGARPALVLDTSASPARGAVAGRLVSAHGRTRVQGVTVDVAGRGRRKVACDAVVVSLPPSPAYELARHAGARVVFRAEPGSFAVEADGDGRTRVPEVLVAGDVLGADTAARAAASGRRAAGALVREMAR
ncbi:MAG TPA: 2Fe-2S iron-sulfur cluster-binding protein [Myxococcaceae bacterium]|nr:2Fe-2S iron-sulfur cluster-binding protein [Myxococcaceae bacterium]